MTKLKPEAMALDMKQGQLALLSHCLLQKPYSGYVSNPTPVPHSPLETLGVWPGW